jgi:SH3-like domain-containing protein
MISHRPTLIAAALLSVMGQPASASFDSLAATSSAWGKDVAARWTIAQGPSSNARLATPVDPDNQGGAPFAPPSPSPSPVPQFRVSNVASNDVLNIRSGPDANSAIVRTIPPYGRGILIKGSCVGQWCPIDYQGSQGWVNRRYLTSD